MKVKSFENNTYQKIIEFGLNRPWTIFLGLLYVFSALFALTSINGRFLLELNPSVIQFLLSSVAFIFLLVIGYNLLSNKYRTIWGLSFLVYAVTFLGLSLNAINSSFASLNDPLLSQFWLLPLIILNCGLWIGTSSLFFENKKLIYLPSLLIFVLGNSWFLFGSIVLKNMELTISIYSLGLFVPVVLGAAFIWYHFGKDTQYVSPWFLAIGFGLFGVIHIFWNPWYTAVLGPMFYPIFILYIVSLGLILTGIRTLTKESNNNTCHLS